MIFEAQPRRIHGQRCSCGAEVCHIVIANVAVEADIRVEEARQAAIHRAECGGSTTEFEEAYAENAEAN